MEESKGSIDLKEIFLPAKQNLDGEREYIPLRKKLKRKDTGKEYNFVAPYLNYPQLPLSFSDEDELELFRLENRIEVEGENVDPPIVSFENAGFPYHILKTLSSNGIFVPTPIQMQVLPCVFQGRDIIGLAETGSGKTLAFLLPMLFAVNRARVMQGDNQQLSGSPSALLLVPTRELVEQLFVQVEKLVLGQSHYSTNNFSTSSFDESDSHTMFFKSNEVSVLGIYGGTFIMHQVKHLENPVDVIVATPGRLIDLIDRRAVNLDYLCYLVMDEVDKMLDLELEGQLRLISSVSRAIARQTLIFSATFPLALERLARSSVMNPIVVRVNMGNQKGGITNSNVQQEVHFVQTHKKKEKLLELLRSTPQPPVLIFCNTQRNVDLVVGLLRSEQFHAAGLHGNKPQEYRFNVLNAFRSGYLDVLVATDVISRGIDVYDIPHVIMFDLPFTIEDYIHRCGRTGRAGKLGTASSLLTLDCSIAVELRRLLRETKQKLPPELENTKKFNSHGRRG